MVWCLDFLRKENHSFELHHERFRQHSKMESSGWGISEHQEFSLMLQHLACYDQCDLVNLAATEAIVRRLCTIEFSYADKVAESAGKPGGKLSSEEQVIFGGLARHHSALMLPPELLDYVRAEAERSASLAKNLRKAREEKEAGKKK